MRVRVYLGLLLVLLCVALVGCNDNSNENAGSPSDSVSMSQSDGASIQAAIKLDKPTRRPAYMGNMRQIGWYDFEYAENGNYPTRVYISDMKGKRTGYYSLVMNEKGFPIKMLEYEMDGTLREDAPQFQLTYDWKGCVTRAVANVNGKPIEYEMKYNKERKNIECTIYKDGTYTTTSYNDNYRAITVSVTYEAQSESQKNATCHFGYENNIESVEIFNSNGQRIEKANYDADGTELFRVIQEYYDNGIRKSELYYEGGRLVMQYAFYETGITKQIVEFNSQWKFIQSYNQQGELTEEVSYFDEKVDALFKYSYLYGDETQITLQAYDQGDDLMWVVVYVKDASNSISNATVYSKGTTEVWSCSADKHGGRIELQIAFSYDRDYYEGTVISITVYNANGEMVEAPYFEVFEQEQPDNLIEEEYENGVLVKKTEYTEWGYIETHFYPNGQVEQLWQWVHGNLKQYYLYDESGNCFEYCEYDDSGVVINGQWEETAWIGEQKIEDIYVTVKNYICREETYRYDGKVIIQEKDKDGKLLTRKTIGTNGDEESSVVYTYRENGTKAMVSGHQFGVAIWKEYDEEERLVNGWYWISSTLDQTGVRHTDCWEKTENYLIIKQEERLTDGTLVANKDFCYNDGVLTHTMSYVRGILVSQDQYDLNGLFCIRYSYSYQADGSCILTEYNADYQCTVIRLSDSNGAELWRVEYTYHINGKKATMHRYENHKQTEWAEYDENEAIVSGWLRQGDIWDENGKKIGDSWCTYENSAKVKAEGYLLDGRVSYIFAYNRDEKIIQSTSYSYQDDGGCTIVEMVNDPEGTTLFNSVQKEIDAEGNERRRIEITYYANGSIASTSRYENGVRSEWEEYDVDGTLINGRIWVYWDYAYEYGRYCVDRSLSGYRNDYENPNNWTCGHLIECRYPEWTYIYHLVENYKLMKEEHCLADGTVVAVREYHYDEMGRKTYSLYYEDNVLLSRNEYDESGKKMHSSFYENDVLIARNEYDENGLLSKQTRWLENGNQKITEYIVFTRYLDDGSQQKQREIVRAKVIDSAEREVKCMECTFHDNGKTATSISIHMDEDGAAARREEYTYDIDGKTSTWVAYEYDVKTEWKEYGEHGLKNAWYKSGSQISGVDAGSVYWELYEDYRFIKRDQFSAEGRLLSSWKFIYNEKGEVIGSVIYYYHEDGTVTENWL